MLSLLATMLLAGGFGPGAGGGSASPLTTKGDIHGFSTVDARLPTAANGQCLQTDSAQALGIKWGSCGGGATFNTVNVTVTFDATGLAAPVVVTGQTWVGASSAISCRWANLGAVTNNTSFVYLAAGLDYSVGEYVVGTGFTVYATSANGATGNFNLSCVGG